MNNVYLIGVTGGPCAGKSTGIDKIIEKLTEKGYMVFLLPEGATFLMGNGIKPKENKNDDGLTMYDFEEIVIAYQLELQKLYIDMAKKYCNKDVIILCDRGIPDVLAYIPKEQYISILNKFGINEISARDMYDMAIHMISPAVEMQEFYTKANNKHRRENCMEAAEKDQKTLDSWTGHPHLRVINAYEKFEDKINHLMSEIYSFLGLPIPIEIEKKYLIKMPDIDYLINEYRANKSEILQTYLLSKHEEERVRQRGVNGNYWYTNTIKIKINEKERLEQNETISKEDYLACLMRTDTSLKQIRKNRYNFVYNHQYFELDVYPISNEVAVLEIELTNVNCEVGLPPFIDIIKDVTDDPRYKNAALAKDMTPLTKF
ncbi:MAG: AAA family ATPase [Clostridia bacterium]|nr:AAA family ATPase [Clostridia bacterium]MDD4375606.1 AAA family ATPase [Clostridia bacterium]